MRYPWYDVVSGTAPMEQGDILLNCPVVVPQTNSLSQGAVLDFEIAEFDIIVMTQSCDLAHGRSLLVCTCPVWQLADYARVRGQFGSAGEREMLRQGRMPGLHLLNKCDLSGHACDHLVADFRSTYGVPFQFLAEFAKQQDGRLRLLPPYREHLSQAFARFFMRVGLPTDIPPFKSR